MFRSSELVSTRGPFQLVDITNANLFRRTCNAARIRLWSPDPAQYGFLPHLDETVCNVIQTDYTLAGVSLHTRRHG